MTSALDIRIDVSQATGLANSQIAASVFLPDPARIGDVPIILFAAPGGGYSRGYFDMHFAGREGYSEAQYHTERGFIYVTLDHLGVGGSTTEHLAVQRIEHMAAANDAAVREIVARLEAGTLKPDFPAISQPFVAGSGQSLGGGLTMIMQGRHRSYAAIVLLGISATHTVLPQPTPELARLTRSTYVFTRATPNAELMERRAQKANPDYQYAYHYEDQPADVVAADMSGGNPRRVTTPPFGSPTVPPCVMACNSPHFFAAEASQIDVPVLMAMGERDVCPEPLREPAAFDAASDVSIFIVPGMAHMHNFANTRARLWQRTHAWVRMVAEAARVA